MIWSGWGMYNWGSQRECKREGELVSEAQDSVVKRMSNRTNGTFSPLKCVFQLQGVWLWWDGRTTRPLIHLWTTNQDFQETGVEPLRATPGLRKSPTGFPIKPSDEPDWKTLGQPNQLATEFTPGQHVNFKILFHTGFKASDTHDETLAHAQTLSFGNVLKYKLPKLNIFL